MKTLIENKNDASDLAGLKILERQLGRLIVSRRNNEGAKTTVTLFRHVLEKEGVVLPL